MASVKLRGDSWMARVKRIGYPPQSKTFKTKAAAGSWARRVESSMDDYQAFLDDTAYYSDNDIDFDGLIFDTAGDSFGFDVGVVIS